MINNYVFTLWIKIKINWKIYYIIRNLDKYIYNEVFDFKLFYNENYAIFENNNSIWELIHITNWEIIWYLNLDNFNDIWKYKSYKNIEIKNKPSNNIFFIEWWVYDIYDYKNNIIHKLIFFRRVGNFGIKNEIIPYIWEVQFVIYPSKIVDNKFIDLIVNEVNSTFPESVVWDSWSSFNKIKNDILVNSDFNTIVEYLEKTKLFIKQDKKTIKIKKKDFNLLEYELTSDLESYILWKWWFDKIEDDDIIELEKKHINYNILENQYILWIFKYFNKNWINVFDKLISIYEKLWVLDRLDDKFPKKLFQHPIYIRLIDIYININNLNPSIKYSIWYWEILWSDPIKSINLLYEPYCYIEFKKILENIWFSFSDDFRSKLYDEKNKQIIRYEYDNSKWFIIWKYKWNDVKLYLWDRFTYKNSRNYKLIPENMDFSFLNEKFHKISDDWLSPDITLEIWDKLYICDVKFSSFRDFDTKLDYPNPDYFINELQKYRKIIVNWSIIDTPIIIFYPWDINIKTFEKFKIMQDLILKSYNVFIFPIYLWNFDNLIFKEHMISQFKKYIIKI